MRPDPLPANVSEECPHPSEISTGNDYEIFAGRLGDALIECRAEKAVSVEAYNQVRSTIIGQQ